MDKQELEQSIIQIIRDFHDPEDYGIEHTEYTRGQMELAMDLLGYDYLRAGDSDDALSILDARIREGWTNQ